MEWDQIKTQSTPKQRRAIYTLTRLKKGFVRTLSFQEAEKILGSLIPPLKEREARKAEI